MQVRYNQDKRALLGQIFRPKYIERTCVEASGILANEFVRYIDILYKKRKTS